MQVLFTDASFDYRHTKKAKDVVRGKIAVSDGTVGKIKRIEKVAIGKVQGLKQYNNVLELIAIGRAIEIASETKDADNSLKLFTDSKVAMYWARAGKIKPTVATQAHLNALEYVRNARNVFNGVVTFNFIGRDHNPAGHLLENELKRESPHAI